MSYTQVFGGTTIYPSDVSYLALDLDADTALEWPLEASTALVAARIIDVTPSGAYAVILPPADQTGLGQTILFNNLGPSTITIKDNDGGTVASIAQGEQWQVYLFGNADAAGDWRVFRYGAATAQAQASSLAGYGLTATGSTLSQNYPVLELSTDFTLGAANRAQTVVWTGAAGTLTLPAAAAVGSGWFVNVRNEGSGDFAVDPAGSETVNGDATLALRPTDSAIIISNGTGWYSVGLGQSAVFAFDYTSIDLTGESSPYTLSGAELNRIAYQFVGTLVADMEIIVPGTIQQYWVDNQTTGSYTLGLRTSTQVTPVTVEQNARAILYSNGTNVVAADTSGLATPIAIIDGGTGATTAGGALTNLGGTSVGVAVFTAVDEATARNAIIAAKSGANSDITSLSGLTTPLSVAQGGTGAATLTSGYLLKGNGTSAVSASVVYDDGANVGIGTASPSAKLDVNGQARASTLYATSATASSFVSRLTNQDFQLYATNGVATSATGDVKATIGLYYADTLANLNGGIQFARGGGGTDGWMNFLTSGTERMRIDSAGSVVIGGTNAVSSLVKLTLTDGTITQTHGYFSGGVSYQGTTSNHPTAFLTNNAERMRIDASGNVGIGTSSPAVKLDVNGSVFVGYTASGQTLSVFNGDTTNRQRITVGMSGTDAVLNATRNSGTVPNMIFSIDSAENMRIGSSGNVGIGTTAPSKKFVVSDGGNIGFEVSPNDASAGYTRLLNYNRSTSQYTPVRYEGSTQTWYVGTAGTTRAMDIDASGQVGIGATPASTYRLTVAGDVRITNSGAETGALQISQESNQALIQTRYSQPLLFGTSTVERMRIDSSGNVGIGTSAPQRPLHVFYDSAVVGAYSMVVQGRVGGYGAGVSFQSVLTGGSLAEMARITADGEAAWDTTAANQDAGLRFYTALDGTVAEKMRLNASGNVGIGLTSPATKLDIFGGDARVALASGSSATLRGFQMASGTTEFASLKAEASFGETRLTSGFTGFGGFTTFYTNGSERARIDSSGNVLINRTGSSGLGKLNVEGGADVTGGSVYLCRDTGNVSIGTTDAGGKLTVYSTTSTPAIYNRGLSDSRATATTQTSGTSYFDYFTYNGSAVGSITSTGSTTAYNTSSDVRLKENIQDADDASALVDAIQVRQFDWKAEGTHQRYGMIAQELDVVAPEAVTKGRTDEDMWGVDYSKLVPMLIKEIQSLRARVAQLEGE